MDLWVVAAAAGAGYIAKNLQNMSLDDEKGNPVGPSCTYGHNIQSGSRNFLQQLRERTCPLRRLSQKSVPDDSDVNFLEAGLASTAAGNIALEDYGLRLISTLQLASSAKEESLGTDDAKSKMVFQRAGMKNLPGSRRCRTDLIRPIKSCFDEKTEDDKTCCYSSNSSTIKPLLVTDATRIYSSFSEFEGCKDQNSTSSCLEIFEAVEEPRKSGPDASLLFVTAMTVGILSATSAWKTEVDNLNKQLKYMQNLVQDLHEELDMKEMLMVKDLTDEAGGKDTPLSIEEPIASPLLDKCDGMNGNDKYTENLELFSKIEAELEAELEMLESNMKGSSAELGTDPKRAIVQGELNTDSEDETTESNHCQPTNYSVPPWELRFRLHELIESRLQTRIDELEAALSYNQNRDLYCDTESSSTCECYERDNTLSGSNADAYKETGGISGTFTDDEDQHNF